ncbi:discoidin domain-containing protein [Sinomicrobium weinanense]|uniref:Discoidin domain-containing protein n=1 Tax=Sinomicrobium weinanense TaxID=2842200 RepID=A0A926JUW2_9FLAO|nr:discoidin domain-containing protein [Sinomicrobium weinanense]MBC9797809.1 discoidin domain-containing protein [Sinomicrobium weinanense]MBU3125958.1 discoidin domain-containing protein [Sinomicrobium weinanense]
MKQTYLLFLLFLIVLSSCKNNSQRELEWALGLAGENRDELEKVLEHYSKAEEDSSKYKAACFLITKIMPYETYMDTPNYRKMKVLGEQIKDLIRDYGQTIDKDSLTRRNQLVTEMIKEYENKNGKIIDANALMRKDVETLSSTFLIENIEYAFKAWDLPWARTYNFQEFCEYILPYRSGKQRPEPWRKFFFEELTSFREGLKGETDPVEVCNKLNTFLTKRKFMWSQALDHAPQFLSGPFMYECKVHGNCESMSNLVVEAMRSIGISVTEIIYNKYGHVSQSHQTNAVLASDRNWKLFDPLTESPAGESAPGASATKIYRRRLIKREDLNNAALQKLRLFGWDDITSEVTKAYDIPVRLTSPISSSKEIVYLCIFNRNHRNAWEPIDWTLVKNDSVTFKDIGGKGVVYLAMIEDSNGGLISVSNPFILHEDGRQTYIVPQKERDTMRLLRKYHPKNDFLGQTIGGVFQASNDKEFRDKVDLYQIQDTLRLINHEISIKMPTKYQYIRYLFPKESPGNIAKIEIKGGGGERLSGKIMTDKKNVETPSMKNAFDGDPLSFVYTGYQEDGQWLGLDLGEQKEIKSIVFCPRTDKNDIWPGCIYELLYWDGQWISLGRKQAFDDYHITYNEVPEGALFWLRNHTEGREERIFTYENQKQVWW